MIRRCAVIIGVDRTGSLPQLAAAASGASEFQRWAESQGFVTTLLTDKNGGKVTLDAVKTAVRLYVDEGVYEQMVVFFSGHGILRGPDYELWLLSGAPRDANEAVNVPGSIVYSRNAGIPHVVIISDACRSRPDSMVMSQIQGSIIFPNEEPQPPRPVVDIFYATLPGDPALEASDQEARSYNGVFSRCLLDALDGKVPQVIEDFGGAAIPRWGIPSWRLKGHLETVVPNRIQAIDFRLNQFPEIRVESHPPRYLTAIEPDEVAGIIGTVDRPKPKAIDAALEELKAERIVDPGRPKTVLRALKAPTPEQLLVAKHLRMLEASMETVKAARGRQSFETGTGFTLVGGSAVSVHASRGLRCDLFMEFGAQQVRVHADQSRPWMNSVLLVLPNGTSVPLVSLPGFVGTVVLEDEKIVAINYSPVRSSAKYYEYEASRDTLEHRRAFVAVAARRGVFRVNAAHDASDQGDYLRVQKGIDPTLGLFAVYAYLQAGNLEEIRSVYQFLVDDLEVMPFDVALAAGKLSVSSRVPTPVLVGGSEAGRSINRSYDSSTGSDEHPTGPFCPILTQGWSLLEPWKAQLPEVVIGAGSHLRPGLFTTFGPEAVPLLISGLESGEIS